jgi:molybdopterin-guanine dinucleotide biosynthesis adapter protein
LNVLGIVGWSGSGKTTLLVAVLPLLRASGLTVSTIKNVHHEFDLDQPGKDSHRHRLAGAHEVLIASSRRWALLHEFKGPEAELPSLLARMEPVDPKLEVFRPELGKPSLWDRDPEIVAVATDSAPDVGARILLPLSDPATIATWMRTLVVTNDWSGS